MGRRYYVLLYFSACVNVCVFFCIFALICICISVVVVVLVLVLSFLYLRHSCELNYIAYRNNQQLNMNRLYMRVPRNKENWLIKDKILSLATRYDRS